MKITTIGCVGPRESPRAELQRVSNQSNVSVLPANPADVTFRWVSLQDLSSL